MESSGPRDWEGCFGQRNSVFKGLEAETAWGIQEKLPVIQLVWVTEEGGCVMGCGAWRAGAWRAGAWRALASKYRGVMWPGLFL